MRERKLVRKYKTINDQELRRMFCLLTKFVQISEKSSKKAEKIKIAKGLVKGGVSVDIVSKTIGLSADECVEEKTGSIYCQIGKKIKEWKRVHSEGFSRENEYNPDQIAEYRLNFSVLFGVMRQKLYQVLISTKKLSSPF